MDSDETSGTAIPAGGEGAESPRQPGLTEAARAERERRQQREGAALRRNLLRRKAQARRPSDPAGSSGP